MSMSPEDLLADALEARNVEAAAAIRDGRRMRAERGRAAVLNAAYELVNGGDYPTIATIAERAGVSERTVFRYYPDREALLAGLAGELIPLIAPHLSNEFEPGDLDSRLRQLVRRRIDLVRIGGAFASAVDLTSRSSDLAADLRSLRLEAMRDQVRAFLSPECTGRNAVVLPAIQALLDYPSVTSLLRELPEDEVAGVLRLAVLRLLGD